MQIATQITEKLNPGHTPVFAGDMPVYALGKETPWKYPEISKRSVWVMGPLHNEQAFMDLIGNWLEGSGWTQIYESAGISTPGRIESFLNVSDIKRTRYAHKVTSSRLLKVAQKAHQAIVDDTSYEDWKTNLEKKSVKAEFCFTVIDYESLLFKFIKNIRSSDFDLHIACLHKMVMCLFALDHINYSRWMPVLLKDM